jgi:hypothetical protein
MFADSYLVSLSDTQAVTTLALLISAYFFVGCTISAYHYDLVCSLVLMSSAAYIGSMVVIHSYFDTKWWLILPRVAMIVVNFVLAFLLFSRRSAIFPSFRPLSNIKSMGSSSNTGLVLPATCFIDHPGVSNVSNPHNFTASLSWITNATSPTSFNASFVHGNSHISTSLTNATMPAFALFASNDDISSTFDLVVLSLLLVAFIITASTSTLLFFSNGKPSSRHKIAFFARCLSFLIAYAIAFYGLARFSQLWDWMNYDSGWFADGDGEKKIDSFGQLMPLVLLTLPILALIEQFAGEFVPFPPYRKSLFQCLQIFRIHIGPFSYR